VAVSGVAPKPVSQTDSVRVVGVFRGSHLTANHAKYANGNPQRRQARHICRTKTKMNSSPVGAASSVRTPDDVAPDGALSVGGWRCYKYVSPDGL